jgi:isopentenyl-diphosphate delta-isomerase
MELTSDQVVLVDADDVVVGVGDKLRAHREGALHRAFSVFVFNREGALLLQKRARTKYHSGGLWSNTCCSHPRPGETTEAGARRRLREEMGFECELRPELRFTYRVELANGLIEHEVDHVLSGWWDGTPHPDAREVEDWRWCSPAELAAALRDRPHEFTLWLPIAWRQLAARRAADGG